MNTIIVTAHPSSVGHTHRIAQAYREAREKQGHHVELLNLYAPENQLPFLAFESMKQWPISPEKNRMKELLSRSDELVFVHPVWWGAPPAILKNWIDHMFEAGFAFRYNKDGKIEKLFAGKTAKVFVTCGAPGFIYHLMFFPLKTFWKTAVLGFCGVKLTDLSVLGSMDKGAPEERTARFDRFLERVRRMAA